MYGKDQDFRYDCLLTPELGLARVSLPEFRFSRDSFASFASGSTNFVRQSSARQCGSFSLRSRGLIYKIMVLPCLKIRINLQLDNGQRNFKLYSNFFSKFKYTLTYRMVLSSIGLQRTSSSKKSSYIKHNGLNLHFRHLTVLTLPFFSSNA